MRRYSRSRGRSRSTGSVTSRIVFPCSCARLMILSSTSVRFITCRTFQPRSAQRAPHEIVEQERAKVPEVRRVVDRRAASVDAHRRAVGRSERLDRRVSVLYRRNSAMRRGAVAIRLVTGASAGGRRKCGPSPRRARRLTRQPQRRAPLRRGGRDRRARRCGASRSPPVIFSMPVTLRRIEQRVGPGRVVAERLGRAHAWPSLARSASATRHRRPPRHGPTSASGW